MKVKTILENRSKRYVNVVDQNMSYLGKETLEKTEWAIINGQSRDTGNIGHKTQNEDKENKNTTQITKMVNNIDQPQHGE